MVTPVDDTPQPTFNPNNPTSPSSEEEHTFVGGGSVDGEKHDITLNTSNESQQYLHPLSSSSQARAQEHRLNDDLALLQAERVVSQQPHNGANLTRSASMHRSRSRRSDPMDEFDANTNPIHEKTAGYRPPEHPSTNLAKAFKKIHNSSFLVRYFTYITPLVLLILIPLLLGALVFEKASVGGVSLLWFSIWLEIVWLTLWAAR
ncbi:MAG: hypothetical protein Q9187_006185, partial [Circinaria calcarea]